MEKDFIKAAKNGDLSALKLMLTQDPELIHSLDKDGSSALHCASWKGHEPCVSHLIGAGADVNLHNQNDHWGTTPLHAAAHGNQPAIAKLLLEAGADPSALDANGKSPLDHTTFHNAKAAAKVLQEWQARS